MAGRVRITIGSAALAVCLLFATSLRAQVSSTDRDGAIKEARSLAGAGDREGAIRILEAFYARAPLDGAVVQSLAGLLAEAGHTDRAKAVLGDYTAKRGDDTKALSALAALDFQTGEKDKGMEVIERIVARAPGELWPYQIGLDALMSADMKTEMLAFIDRARHAVGDSILFAVDAAQVQRDVGKFGLAAREYLRAGLARDMSSEITADYLVSMAEDDKARPAVTAALKKAVAIASFTQTAALSLAEIYLMDGECAPALEMITEVAGVTPPSADILVNFARQASRAGCFGECAKSYDLALRGLPKDHKAAEYLVEKARCEMAAGRPDEAMATFDMVAEDYRAYKAADDALMGRALILRDRGDLEEAVAEADRVMESKYTDSVYEAILFKADCQVLMGRLDDAFETYDRVESDWPAEYAQEAFFNMGEISLYRGEFDDAQSYYNVTLRHYPDEARANDSIDRLLLIKSCGGEGAYLPELKDFGRALLLARQGESGQAVGMLRDLGGMEDRPTIRVESLRVLAETYEEQGLLEQALRTYKLIGDTLETAFSASALEAVGDIYMRSGRIQEAVDAYENLILKFPGSVSAGEARRKIDLAARAG
jgi:tetratricopeptide (TPR) repeat protein